MLVKLTPKNIDEYLPQIIQLESQARYPLGNDYFTIDHGQDYFEFFNRLGDCRYYVWKEDAQVAAVACLILRDVPEDQGHRFKKAWYFCDLKVSLAFRGKRLSKQICTSIFLRNYLRCRRGYAITMNPQQSHENRIVRFAQNFKLAAIKNSEQIFLWSIDAKIMKDVQPIIERYRGNVSYLSLRGVKDILLESTQKALPLVHVQFGPFADKKSASTLDANATYMFCSPCNDVLTHKLQALGITPSSSASVISHRIQTNWKWLLTSDI